MRERGLKYECSIFNKLINCRSREGAWIEIVPFTKADNDVESRSREGAWIEIFRF